MRLGFGQAGGVVVRGYAQQAGLPTDPQALLQLMPQSVQNIINGGVSTYGTLGPAIDLAGKVSAGGTLDEAGVIAAVSAAAGFVGGPIAGAAMAVAGSVITGAEALMRSFFDLLGLYDHPRDVSMCGLIPSGSVPYGPDDPNWIHLDTPTVLHDYLYGPQAFRNANVVLNWGNQTDSAKASLYQQWLAQALGILHPDDPFAGSPNTGVAPDFERYFAALLKTDLEKWANCNPYVPPRQLLYAAQAAWNAANSNHPDWMGTHGPPTVFFQPHDFPPDPDTSLISMLLGNMGDPALSGSRSSPLEINTMSQPAATTSHATSTATKVVAPVAVFGLGVLAYAWIAGHSVDFVLSHLWNGTKRFVRRVVGETEHLTPNPLGLFERQSTTVQSLLFPRPEFSPSSARSWARKHGYRAGKVHSTGGYVRLRQKPPSSFRRGSFRTISFGGSGIKAVIGHLR